MKILQKFTHTILKLEPSSTGLPFGPFNSTTQRRWKKRPVSTAQTRLESQRTRDSKLDKLTSRLNQLARSLTFHRLISARKRSPFVSLHLISRWKNVVGLHVSTTVFLRKYPHVFEDKEAFNDVCKWDNSYTWVETCRRELGLPKDFRESILQKYSNEFSLPTGFKIEAGYRERLRNWQRLPYVKPYERKEVVRVRTCGGAERFEKRAVGILHEFLCGR
ncbi:hypothetical protein C3L33_02284, partial [Rhododendron williamsianum]